MDKKFENLSIRRVSSWDNAEDKKIYQDFSERLEKFISKERKTNMGDAGTSDYLPDLTKDAVIIAYCEGKPAGFAIASDRGIVPKKGHLVGIPEVYVDNKFRGQGVGKYLMFNLLDIAHEISGDNDLIVSLSVTSNGPAQRLYESVGFTTDKRAYIGKIKTPKGLAPAEIAQIKKLSKERMKEYTDNRKELSDKLWKVSRGVYSPNSPQDKYVVFQNTCYTGWLLWSYEDTISLGAIYDVNDRSIDEYAEFIQKVYVSLKNTKVKDYNNVTRLMMYHVYGVTDKIEAVAKKLGMQPTFDSMSLYIKK